MSKIDLTGVTIAFDLDGTLVDSAPDLVATLNRILAREGIVPVPLSQGRHLVGHEARALLRHGYEAAGSRWDEDARPDLFDDFIADYVAHIADDSRPFEGVIAILEALARRGATLCVATNKRTELALTLLDALDMTRHFAAVVGPDKVSAKKPDAAHLIEAIAMAGGDPARAVMVGDASTDTGTARAAGVPCVVCTFGYNDQPFEVMGGDIRIDRFGDLSDALATLLAPGYVPAS